MSYMLIDAEQEIANEWNKYLGYTVRPVASTVAYYHKIITRHTNKNSQALLYGGTPEIRTILQKKLIPTTLVDKSAMMVRAMGKLTKAQRPLAINELFIESDWLSLADLNKKFDMIIGDDAINMVPWPSFNKFLENTQRLLAKNGVFICHLLVKPNKSLIKDRFENLFIDYQSKKIKSPYDLASRLNFLCYDEKTYAMGWQQTIRCLGLANLNKFLPDFNFYEIFKNCNSQFYCPPQLKFTKLVEKYFAIAEIFYPHEHDYCLFEPVYVLKKIN